MKLIGNRTGAGLDGDVVGWQMVDMGVQFVKTAACETRGVIAPVLLVSMERGLLVLVGTLEPQGTDWYL
ncbi:hypothetical protein [Lysobacter soli]|uniref:hypothetical protein n=1 Tax=Lysobacter soli TaxID=453783 RepID=UPI00241032A5|nr:hypothetical protein [Lysobacter soli]MDG2519369.1 hypothetical protein [Lysobacter soli]